MITIGVCSWVLDTEGISVILAGHLAHPVEGVRDGVCVLCVRDFQVVLT